MLELLHFYLSIVLRLVFLQYNQQAKEEIIWQNGIFNNNNFVF